MKRGTLMHTDETRRMFDRIAFVADHGDEELAVVAVELPL